MHPLASHSRRADTGSAHPCSTAVRAAAWRAARPRRRLRALFSLVCAQLSVLVLVLVVVNAARAEPPCEAFAKWRDATGGAGACPRPLNGESARGLALGTGLRATAMSTSALAYNPAGLVVGKVYHLEGVVDYMPDLKTVALGGAIVDSSTSRLSAGMSLRGFLSGQGGLGGIDGRLGLAFPLSDGVSIGVSGRYVNATRDTPTPTVLDSAGMQTPLPAPAAVRAVKGFTMDASIRVAPTPSVMLHAGSYNLISLDSVYAPLMLGGGVGVALGSIAVLGGDVLVDMSSFDKGAVLLGAGAEVFAGAAVPLRAGYSYDTKRSQHTLSLGVGYTDRSVGLDLSLRQDLGGEGDTRIMGAFRVYVH